MLEVLPLSQADRLPAGPTLAEVDPDTPLADQMMAAAQAAGWNQPPGIVDMVIDELDCEALLDRVPRPMSRGELQICSILITLSAPTTSLSVVDPTAGLDARRSKVVAELFETLAELHPIHIASDAPGFTTHLRWEPLPLADVTALFSGAPKRWFFSGGYALELFLGHPYRDHSDIDVGIVRAEAAALRDVLAGWDIQVAAAGTLSTWDGAALDPSLSQNNLWCRPSPDAPFAIDVTVGDGTADDWIYRRDPSIRFPWSEAVLHTGDDVPYLAPELQLLYKSTSLRPKDTHDAMFAIPRLAPDRRSWLKEQLPAAHEWHQLL